MPSIGALSHQVTPWTGPAAIRLHSNVHASTYVDIYISSCMHVSLLAAGQAPMNYSDPTSGSITMAMIRIPSPLNNTDAYRGPVLFNPGGPSQSGVDAILQIGAELSAVIGAEFDIVSFDPRGVARSTPPISFFTSAAERVAFDFGPHATDAAAAPGALPAQWAHFQVLGALARDRDAGVGLLAHVTTDNVARDMLRVVRAHGEDKIRYWGISYGSVLGATFAAMFPDNIERLIIDGVFDMEGYYNTDWSNETLDTDKVLHAFFSACHAAGPSHATSTRPAQPPSPATSMLSYGIVDAPTLKNAIFSALFTPYQSFSVLARGLSELARGNGSVVLQLAQPLADEVNAAVSCGNGRAVAGVRGWRIHPDNFKGPIIGNTSFPLLIIGNTGDPVTPLAGIKGFPGSVVLTQDSLGHTSFTSPSNCTLAYVQQYFQNGTLPAPGVVCAVTAPLFPTEAEDGPFGNCDSLGAGCSD
ncbi:Alpha/Beta hydrolase protein [Pholiota molesta]|nr:Alpha/Beta hydrolase protein [Pholiota molesta]